MQTKTRSTLLRHLTPGLAERPCLLVITVREAPGLAATALADIHRRLPTTTLDLHGLTVDDLVEVLNAIGVKLADDVQSVASQLAARTSGNPFYVTQLVLDAQTTRRPFDAAAVPDAVAQLVARRLDALAPDLRSTLALAAVAGVEFDVATLESCSSIEPERLLDIVEALCAPTIHRRTRTGAIHLRARARARCRARGDHRHSWGTTAPPPR